MIKRLYLKFIVINMGITTILFNAILGLALYFTSANLEIESIRVMERIASQPSQMNASGEPGEDARPPFFTLQLSPHGELLDADDGYYDLSDDAFLGGLAQTVAASPRHLGVLEEYNLRYHCSDAPMSRFLVFADISSERATLDGLRRTCLPIDGLSFLVFLRVSVLLSKWAVRPVERVWQQQRQFVVAASHESKTPPTVIMTNAELFQDKVDEARRSTFSSSILTMFRQIRALIEQMLELARTDSAESHLVLWPVDLSGLTARSLLPFESLFSEQGLTLIPQVDEGITVSSDEEAPRRALEILLDNAQKYSSPGGETQVTLHRRGRDHCVLMVANQGEPIPPGARRQIFQRFYRADSARSRNGSFGLGLSIAEGIMIQHHGIIDVTYTGGFNRFRVELPYQQEQRRRSKPCPEIRE